MEGEDDQTARNSELGSGGQQGRLPIDPLDQPDEVAIFHIVRIPEVIPEAYNEFPEK
ncbi:hypothetical protein JYU34_022211 [Plutella xylostella]|uniref:Uncharacterized protein n=1 Tax=Plutella xylostella TaxID=51655 RepID=A0ABQ7PQR8_PLUXY|nr:hypothetical protein JYU34_022211 [Plutella xylostella]